MGAEARNRKCPGPLTGLQEPAVPERRVCLGVTDQPETW